MDTMENSRATSNLGRQLAIRATTTQVPAEIGVWSGKTQEDPRCHLCDKPGTMQHALFSCQTAPAQGDDCWEMKVDLGKQLVFPNIIHIAQRPSLYRLQMKGNWWWWSWRSPRRQDVRRPMSGRWPSSLNYKNSALRIRCPESVMGLKDRNTRWGVVPRWWVSGFCSCDCI